MKKNKYGIIPKLVIESIKTHEESFTAVDIFDDIFNDDRLINKASKHQVSRELVKLEKKKAIKIVGRGSNGRIIYQLENRKTKTNKQARLEKAKQKDAELKEKFPDKPFRPTEPMLSFIDIGEAILAYISNQKVEYNKLKAQCDAYQEQLKLERSSFRAEIKELKGKVEELIERLQAKGGFPIAEIARFTNRS